jgi:hypothetical protein
MWDDLVTQAVRDGAWWRLPFPDAYPGRLRAWPPWTLAGDLKDVAAWLVQYVALAVTAAGAVVVVVRRPRALTGLVVLALGAVAYLVSRADEAHAQPLAVLACAIAPLAWAAVAPVPRTTLAALRPRRPPEPRTPAAATAGRAAAAAVLALLLAVGAANRLSALVRPPHLVALHMPGVQGIEVPPGEARALPALAALVDRLVAPDTPIYVAPRRSDLVTRSNPLVHFLVRRPNVLSRDVLLQAKPAEQAAIVAALRRARPLVVRWTDPASSAPEPNPRGRPSGSRRLDAYLAGAYRLRARYGYYDVLVPR